VAIEQQQLGRLLDVGVIRPRLRQVYDWSACATGDVSQLLTGPFWP